MSKKAPPLYFDEQNRPVYAKRPDGVAICGAFIKASGQQCQSTARFRNGRCKVHGGMQPSGALSPHYKHGQYTIQSQAGAAAGHRLTEILERIARSPDLLSNRNEIILVTLGIEELANTLAREDSLLIWRDLLRYTDALSNVENSEEDPLTIAYNAQTLAKNIQECIAKGNTFLQTHKEIRKAALDRAKLIEVELKVETLRKSYLPLPIVISLFVEIVNIMKTYIKDDNILKTIGHEIDALSTNPKFAAALGNTISGVGMIDPRPQATEAIYQEVIDIDNLNEEDFCYSDTIPYEES